jgi:ADP-heptose:LPS heptosyltransferase
MKLLYVGDNRNRPNWGCRATSIALRQILDQKLDVSSVVYGDYVAFDPKRGLQNQQPPSLFQRIEAKLIRYLTNTNKQKSLLSFGGFAGDYIGEDPKGSLNRFLSIFEHETNLKFIHDLVSNCDSIVVNAEGSFIFSDPPRRDTLFFLFLVELAEYLGKDISFVNGMISPSPEGRYNQEIFSRTVEAFKKAKFISVRDPESQRLLSNFIDCQYVPDALFSWFSYFENEQDIPLLKNGDFIIPFPEEENYFGTLDFSEPYICVGGSSLAAREPLRATEFYTNLVNSLKSLGTKIILVQACAGDAFLKDVGKATQVPIVPLETPILLATLILAKSSLFVSGRYHPSIMASLGGTPCIFLASNSHKTRSLQEVLEYPEIIEYSAYPNQEECENITKQATQFLRQEDILRLSIKKTVKKNSKKSLDLIEHLI